MKWRKQFNPFTGEVELLPKNGDTRNGWTFGPIDTGRITWYQKWTTATTGGCFRLLENSDSRLLENGDFRVLEDCTGGSLVGQPMGLLLTLTYSA